MLNKILMATVASLITTGLMMIAYSWFKKKPRALPEPVAIDNSQFENLANFKVAIDTISTTLPRTIKEFPPELLYYLEREKCQIPHAKNDKNKQGWFKGHFYKKTQTDYAVVCLTPQKEMTIKVFWGGENPCPISLGYGMVKKYILPEGTENFAYSRSLLKAGFDRLKYYVYYARLKPPSEGQEGIEDTLIGHSSVIYYCLDNKWQIVRTR